MSRGRERVGWAPTARPSDPLDDLSIIRRSGFVEIGLPAARTPMPWTLRAAARYLAEVEGDIEMARMALELIEPRQDAR